MDLSLFKRKLTLNSTNQTLTPDSDSSVCLTPSPTSDGATPIMSNHDVNQVSRISVPWPGSTYIICSASTGKVITFRRGKIVLAPLRHHNANRWECIMKNGMLGFRDPGSYMFLGYNEDGKLVCEQKYFVHWEFCLRHRPDGSYLLLTALNDSEDSGPALAPVGIKIEDDITIAAVISDWESPAIAWDFIKVESSEI